MVRLHRPQMVALDNWITQQRDAPSRPEAIRRLLETALANTQRKSPSCTKTSAAKASEMAGSMIDRLGDKSVPPQELAKRKRRLVKGPSEFREMRDDMPKRKR